MLRGRARQCAAYFPARKDRQLRAVGRARRAKSNQQRQHLSRRRSGRAGPPTADCRGPGAHRGRGGIRRPATVKAPDNCRKRENCRNLQRDQTKPGRAGLERRPGSAPQGAACGFRPDQAGTASTRDSRSQRPGGRHPNGDGRTPNAENLWAPPPITRTSTKGRSQQQRHSGDRPARIRRESGEREHVDERRPAGDIIRSRSGGRGHRIGCQPIRSACDKNINDPGPEDGRGD